METLLLYQPSSRGCHCTRYSSVPSKASTATQSGAASSGKATGTRPFRTRRLYSNHRLLTARHHLWRRYLRLVELACHPTFRLGRAALCCLRGATDVAGRQSNRATECCQAADNLGMLDLLLLPIWLFFGFHILHSHRESSWIQQSGRQGSDHHPSGFKPSRTIPRHKAAYTTYRVSLGRWSSR